MHHQPQSPPLCTTNHIHHITSHNRQDIYTTSPNHLLQSRPPCTTNHITSHNRQDRYTTSPNHLLQSRPPCTTNHITSHNHEHYAPTTTITSYNYHHYAPPITITSHNQHQYVPPITINFHNHHHYAPPTKLPPTITITMHHHPQSPYHNLQSLQPCTAIHNTMSTPPDVTSLHTHIDGISISSYGHAISTVYLLA